MRDPRRYVPLMELKCAKRHVKSDGLYRPRDSTFYRASKRKELHAAALAIRVVRIRESGKSAPKWLREARDSVCSFFSSFFFFCQNRDRRARRRFSMRLYRGKMQ